MPDFSALCKEFETARNLQKPFVVYRKPGTFDVRLFVQKDTELYRFKDEREGGFIFAPFNMKEAAIFFPLDKCEVITAVYKGSHNENLGLGKMDELKGTEDFERRQVYLELVDRCKAFMQRTGTKKIVLSRKEEVQRRGLPVVGILQKLLENYPDAFVYIWYHPTIGMWAGASPETLFSLENDLFKTMALAGTQRIKGDEELVWGLKEREEQQIVTDYITNELRGLITKTTPAKSIKAGQVAHICTELEGTLTKDFGLMQLVNKLHPTPAVCGLPKEIARNFILENEGYDRSFYSGFLGEINLNSGGEKSASSHLFVNLRCMELFEDKAVLFVGGGITSDSNKEKEWEETVAKSSTMKAILI